MSEVQFFQTAMGRTYYERTMPALVAELARLNTLLEKLVEVERFEPSASCSRSRRAKRERP